MAKEQTELELLELEERKQALESRKIQDELARAQLDTLKAEREMKKGNKERGKKDAEKAIADMRFQQSICNHHAGGEGVMAVTMGQGDEERPTCISGIQFTDQRILLRCNRCRKPWRSDLPEGDLHTGGFHGPWAEGVNLFKKSQFKQIAIVGGRVVAHNPLLTPA